MKFKKMRQYKVLHKAIINKKNDEKLKQVK